MRGKRTISNFFTCGDEAVCIDDNFLFALNLDDLGAAVWRTAMINKPCDIPRFRR